MRDDIDLHLAKKVFQRRRELNLTQRQLGDLCGVTFQQVQKYECGANRISASMIWRLAEALDVKVHHFYEGLEKFSVKRAALAPNTRADREAPSS